MAYLCAGTVLLICRLLVPKLWYIHFFKDRFGFDTDVSSQEKWLRTMHVIMLPKNTLRSRVAPTTRIKPHRFFSVVPMTFDFVDFAQMELAQKDKGVYYEKDCQGLHCNMFGISWDCRACYMGCAACEGDQEDLGA